MERIETRKNSTEAENSVQMNVYSPKNPPKIKNQM